MNGKIIVIEGTDCSGKKTQSQLLVENLTKLNLKCITLSFPMYDTPTGKIVGGNYLGKQEIGECIFEEGAVNVDPKIACLYYAADRLYNIEKVNEYLRQGYYVILDRYISSNMAHQGCKIKDKDERFNMFQWIDKLEYWLLNLPKPDMTFFLHVPNEYSTLLKNSRNCEMDKHEEDEEYLKNAEMTYKELAALYNWKTVECVKDNSLRTIEDINKEIINYTKESI